MGATFAQAGVRQEALLKNMKLMNLRFVSGLENTFSLMAGLLHRRERVRALKTFIRKCPIIVALVALAGKQTYYLLL
jgi:hypothetical protein